MNKLEQSVSTFINKLAYKDQILTTSVKWKWYHGIFEGHLLLIRNIFYGKLYLIKNGMFYVQLNISVMTWQDQCYIYVDIPHIMQDNYHIITQGLS